MCKKRRRKLFTHRDSAALQRLLVSKEKEKLSWKVQLVLKRFGSPGDEVASLSSHSMWTHGKEREGELCREEREPKAAQMNLQHACLVKGGTRKKKENLCLAALK